MAKKKIRLFTSMGKKDSIGSPKGIQKRIDAMGNQAPSMADLSIPINISAKRIAQSVKTNKQLKGSKKELAQSARKVLGSVNKGKKLVANARKAIKIPVKNMKKSMSLEQKKPGLGSQIYKIGKQVAKKAIPLVEGASIGYGLFGPNGLVKETFDEAAQHGKKRGVRHRRRAQRPKAKYVSKIIKSSLNKLKDN